MIIDYRLLIMCLLNLLRTLWEEDSVTHGNYIIGGLGLWTSAHWHVLRYFYANHPTSDQLKIVYRIPTWYGLSPVRRLPLALLTNQSFTWSLCRLLSFLLSDTRIAERVLSPRTPVHHVSDERTCCARFLVHLCN